MDEISIIDITRLDLARMRDQLSPSTASYSTLNTFSVKYNQGMAKAGTYRIDLGGGWFYVGSSNNLSRRRGQHSSDLVCGVHRNPVAQNVFNKYGEFVFTVLGHYPVDQIIEREQELLDAHYGDPKCVNVAPVAANSPMTGRKHSDESKQKIGSALVGRKMSASSRAKMSASRTGIPRSQETRAKISASHKGIKPNAETLAKMSASKMGRKLSPETRAKMSASTKGRVFSEEHKAALVAAWEIRKITTPSANLGRKYSPERCANMAAGRAAARAARQQAASIVVDSNHALVSNDSALEVNE
jgi:group I intron endonuclease